MPTPANGASLVVLDSDICCLPLLSAVAKGSPYSYIDGAPWFHWADDSPVVVIPLRGIDCDGEDREFTVCIPGHAITSRLLYALPNSTPPGRPALPWSKWACDALLRDVTEDGYIPPAVCGSRYVTEESGTCMDEDGTDSVAGVAVIYHFDSPTSILQDKDVDTPPEDGTTELPCVYRMNGNLEAPDPAMWAETECGRASFRQTWTDVSFHEDGEDCFYVGEDGLVLMAHDLRDGE